VLFQFLIGLVIAIIIIVPIVAVFGLAALR
jgi:hypothetical protein